MAELFVGGSPFQGWRSRDFVVIQNSELDNLMKELK
jgi:hypothetical protein